MGRQVERSERGLRSGLPRPRVEREEQVREISELKKALNRTRQELARSREVNRTSSDEEGCGNSTNNYTRASTATSRENVLRDSSRDNMIRDSCSRDNLISRDSISRTGSLTGINSGMGSRSGSMNGLASKPSLNRELVSKLRSMTETIKMLSTENVALRQENDNLIANRNKDGDEIMEDQNMDDIVHSYHNQLKAMEEKISELEGQLQKAEAGKDKDKTVDKAEKDKYKSLARRLKEERNNYKEMVEEKRKEQDTLKEEIEKMSDLIGELRQHCSQLQDELETQQVDPRCRRDMSIQTSPQLQRANLGDVSRRTFCRPRRSGSTVSPASTRNNSPPSLSRSNSQSISRQQRGTDASTKGKYSRSMSSPNSSPPKTASNSPTNSPLKNGNNSPGGSTGGQPRRGSFGSSGIGSPAKAKSSPSKSLSSPRQGGVGAAGGAKIVKPVTRQATVIKSGNRRKSESNSASSPRSGECSPRAAETGDPPSYKQSTDNLVSKLPTYKASSSPSKIPTPSKSKLAKMSPTSQKCFSQANSNSYTGSARSSVERDSDERMMSNSNSDEDRSYEKMEVCSEPPALPAPELYLDASKAPELYLDASKDQQDGIELHISETEDAEEEFPAPPPPEDLAKLSFEAQFKIVSETVERACEKYKQAESNLHKETLIEPDTPRTTRKVDNFRQKLAARRIQRTWKHFYQELEEKRAEEGESSYSSLPSISFPEETAMGLEPTTADSTRAEQQEKSSSKACKVEEDIPDAKDTDIANVQAAILGHELRSRGLTFLREGSYATTRNRGGIFTARPWVITSESESDEDEDIKSIQGVVRSHSFRLGTINEGDVFRPGRVGSIRAKFSRQPPDGASAEIDTIR